MDKPFAAEDQPHTFDAVVMVWNCQGSRNHGMKLTVENVDSCCEEHARNSAANIGKGIKERFQNIWGDDYNYEVVEITQRW